MTPAIIHCWNLLLTTMPTDHKRVPFSHADLPQRRSHMPIRVQSRRIHGPRFGRYAPQGASYHLLASFRLTFLGRLGSSRLVTKSSFRLPGRTIKMVAKQDGSTRRSSKQHSRDMWMSISLAYGQYMSRWIGILLMPKQGYRRQRGAIWPTFRVYPEQSERSTLSPRCLLG